MSRMDCDYCDEGNVAVDGWHTYFASTPVDEASYRVPCAINPPCASCATGSVAVDGWHTYPKMDPDEYALMDLKPYRIPCTVNPPSTDDVAVVASLPEPHPSGGLTTTTTNT